MYLKEGAYRIDKENPDNCLGKGSFGKVFKGYDTVNNIWVAVKIINIEMM
jgi:serine/threonine protein kinase